MKIRIEDLLNDGSIVDEINRVYSRYALIEKIPLGHLANTHNDTKKERPRISDAAINFSKFSEKTEYVGQHQLLLTIYSHHR